MENSKEREFILLSVLQKRTRVEQKQLQELACSELDWSFIAGQCIHHRLSGYLYYGIGAENKDCIYSEYYNTLDLLVKAQEIVAYERYDNMSEVFLEFEKNGICYAALKGLFYGMTMYPYGIRKSNDCDVLVIEDDLKKVDEILLNLGYIQSTDRGKTKANKRDILIQRMNYHDTVPYYKQIDSKFHNRIKIDINFHMDSKNNDITKAVLNYGTDIYRKDTYFVRGLAMETQFLHLCIHFYREGSNTLWTSKRRDVLLYKIVDIMNTYQLMSKKEFEKAISLAYDFNVKYHVYYTLYYLNMFYPRYEFQKAIDDIGIKDEELLRRVKVEGKDAFIERNENFVERAFDLRFAGKKDFVS